MKGSTVSGTVWIGAPSPSTAPIDGVATILRRRLGERSVPVAGDAGRADVRVELGIEEGIGAEGFRIEDGADRTRIVGNDGLGLLYGAGRFLRTARYAPERWEPGTWRGTSVPEKPVRGMYFATHFHNFYHDAPLPEVERYLEDVALWGINTLTVWFDMHHYQGIADPAARDIIARLHSLLGAAKGLGLRTALVFIANEGYANSPAPCAQGVEGSGWNCAPASPAPGA